MISIKSTGFILAAVTLAGCTAMTSLSAVQPGATVVISTTATNALPRTESISSTSFGNYEFRADAPGLEPFYGVLPLKFNGGNLALDILFFAPAAFFNLRQVYAFYEFDVAKKQLKYKNSESEEWYVHIPQDSEAAHSKTLLGPKP